MRKDHTAHALRPAKPRRALLAVDDTLVALQTLATAVRKLWGKTAIGITGSMGKTTTKEAVAHLLAIKYRVHRTKGNFNNHFGLPLGSADARTGIRSSPWLRWACRTPEKSPRSRASRCPTRPSSPTSLPCIWRYFDSIAGIARAKYELIEALPHGGTAVLNADDEYVCQFGRDFKGKVVTVRPDSPSADVRAENIEVLGAEGTRFDLVSQGVRQPVHSPLLGKHNVYNVLAAAAVALEHGITPSEIAAACPPSQPADKRGQVVQLGNITVLYDCYNSSPKALMAAVDTLAAMPAQRRIVVAGEMLELGPSGEQLHRDCGRYMAGKKLDFLLGVRGSGEADGRSSARSRHESGVRRHARRSRRVAGPRNARRRRGTAQSFARREIGKSAGDLETEIASAHSPNADRELRTILRADS